MAFTDQCKYAFVANAKGLLDQRGGRGIKAILKELSRESGIPFKTLDRWWYEQGSKDPKNGANGSSQVNSSSSKHHNGNGTNRDQHPTCSICKERPVSRQRRPDGSWYYRDKCRKCRMVGESAYQEKAEIGILCPACGERFKLRKEDVTYYE